MCEKQNICAPVCQASESRPLSKDMLAGLVGLLDSILVFAAGLGLYFVYLGWRDQISVDRYILMLIFDACFTVQIFLISGLYKFKALISPLGHLRKILSVVAIKFLVIIALLFTFKISGLFSRIWAFSWVFTSMILICIGRFAVAKRILSQVKAGALSRNIIIVGGGDQAKKLIKHLESLDEPWNRVVGIFDDRNERIGNSVMNYPVLGNLDDLIQFIRQKPNHDILVALPWSAEERVLNILEKLSVLPVHIGLSPDLAGMHFMPCRWSFDAGFPALSVYRKPISGWESLQKHLEDYILGTAIFLAALPIMMMIAVLVKLDSKGPVLFCQQRHGFNNKLIKVYKFRTMFVDCQDEHAEKLASPGDKRITRLGAWLRRTSLDELPQFYNVLLGDMSLVGPRPHALKAKAGEKHYQEVVTHYAARHKVKPGVTGWAQVNGWRGETDTHEKLIKRIEHDLWYIENWSLLFDLKIIAYTVWVCICGQNAY